MPSNLKRYYGSGDLHFVTTSCYRRQPFLGTARERDLFLNVLEKMRRRYRFVVLTDGRTPPPFGLCHAPRRLWQVRFYDFNVWTERKRIEKLRYIHCNPVKRGLVESPEQWPWSSFRFYLYGEAGPVRINDTDILVMRVRPRAA